jgi:hypothetical protein
VNDFFYGPFYGLPKVEFSVDDGKSWEPGPTVKAGARVRITREDGTVLWAGHSEPTQIKCDCCDGTGIRILRHFVKDIGD